MDQRLWCMACMRERGNNYLCPYCGQPDIRINSLTDCLPPGSVLNERFLVGLALRRSPYAIIYMARDLEEQKRLIVKELFPSRLVFRSNESGLVESLQPEQKELFEYGIQQFLSEARKLMEFEGEKGLVPVRDCFAAKGTAFMAMDFVAGMSFREFIEQKGGRLGLGETCPMILELSSILEKLNAVGIIHGCLSAEDIIISEDKGVVITGFDSARHALKEKEESQAVLKRRKYGLEEKVRRVAPSGPWTDVYSVGEVFYRAITGQAPRSLEERQLHDSMVCPSYLGVNITEAVEQVIIKALAVNPDERYQDLGAFGKALMAAGSGVDGYSPAPYPELPPAPPEEQQLDDLIEAARRSSEGENAIGNEIPVPPSEESLPSGAKRNWKLYGWGLFLLVLLAFPVLAYLAGYIERSGIMGLWEIPAGDEKSSDTVQFTADDDPMEIFVDGEWIYYANNSDGTRLYRINIDGTGRQRLNQDWSVNIVASGDWVYYVNNSEQMNLYRVRIDGSERQKLNDQFSLKLRVESGWVYYTSESDDLAMFRIKTDGTEGQKLHEGCSYCLGAADEWIYFNWINFQNVDDTGLYRMTADGRELQKIGSGLASFGIVDGDRIYYSNKSDGFKVYSMKTDGSEARKLGDDEAENLELANGWIYYTNASDGGRIYRLKADGSQTQKMGDDQALNMMVAGDWIYYRKDSESGSLYRMRLEGGQPQLIVK